MEEVNKNTELDNTDKKLHISDVMNSKKRIIPNVPKDERVNFDVGYHKIPNWLLISFGIILIVSIVCWLYCS